MGPWCRCDDGQVVSGRDGPAGLRAYLGVAGGLATPVLLGSRSSDILAGLGPGPLRPGDRLGPGRAGRARGRLDAPGRDRTAAPVVLGSVPGPHGSRADGPGWPTRGWCGADVDRIGGAPRPGPATGGRRRPGTAGLDPDGDRGRPGAPDGRPIVLLPDHATVGGYPVVACVATADLPRLGQLRAGRRRRVRAGRGRPRPDAAGRRDREARGHGVGRGWFPTAAGT